MAAGDKAIYREITAGGTLSAVGGHIPWDTTVIEETGSFSTDEWTCDEAGHYLVFGSYVATIASGNVRSEVRSALTLSAFGVEFRSQSWGSRTLKNQLNKVICNSAGIVTMLVGDTMKLHAQMTGNSSPANLTFDANRSYMGVIKLDDDADYIRLRSTTDSPVATETLQVYDEWNVDDEVDTGSFGWVAGAGAEWISFTQLGWYLAIISLHARHNDPSAAVPLSCVAVLELDENGDSVTITEIARVTTFLDGQDGCDDGYLNFKLPIENVDVDARVRVRFELSGTGYSDDFTIVAEATTFTAVYLERQDIDIAVGTMTVDDTSAPNPADRQEFDTWTVDEDSPSADSYTSLGNPNRELQIDTNAFTLVFFQVNCSRPSTVAVGQPFNYRYFVRNTLTGPLYGDGRCFTRNNSASQGNEAGEHGMVVIEADDTEDYGLHIFRNTTSTDTTLQLDRDFTSIQFLALGTLFPKVVEVAESVEFEEGIYTSQDKIFLPDTDTVEFTEDLFFKRGRKVEIAETLEFAESLFISRVLLFLPDAETIEFSETLHFSRARLVIPALEAVEFAESLVVLRGRKVIVDEAIEFDEDVYLVVAVTGNMVFIQVATDTLEFTESGVITDINLIRVLPVAGYIAAGGAEEGYIASSEHAGYIAAGGCEEGFIASSAHAGYIAPAGGDEGQITSSPYEGRY